MAHQETTHIPVSVLFQELRVWYSTLTHVEGKNRNAGFMYLHASKTFTISITRQVHAAIETARNKYPCAQHRWNQTFVRMAGKSRPYKVTDFLEFKSFSQHIRTTKTDGETVQRQQLKRQCYTKEDPESTKLKYELWPNIKKLKVGITGDQTFYYYCY